MPYAVVNFVHIEDSEVAAESTRNVVLPRLEQLPGFAHAVFLADTEARRGFSVMIFESREQAAAMAERLGSGQVPSPPGVTFERQEVWEVVASS